MKKINLSAIFLISLASILPAAVSAEPFVISVDGSKVFDQKTGLTWQRCRVGRIFTGDRLTGDCFLISGATNLFNHEDALKFAQTAYPYGGWRLPSIKELSSIVSLTRSNLAIDTTVFPGNVSDSSYWSASPYLVDPNNAWGITFSYGFVGLAPRSESRFVRLVSSNPF